MLHYDIVGSCRNQKALAELQRIQIGRETANPVQRSASLCIPHSDCAIARAAHLDRAHGFCGKQCMARMLCGKQCMAGVEPRLRSRPHQLRGVCLET